MRETTIVERSPVATLINVFTVRPDRQQALIDLLAEATEKGMRHRRGFISANIHASTDGTAVVNYAQWPARPASTPCWTIPQPGSTWPGRPS